MHTETVQVGEVTLTLETGKIARQAHGAVVARHLDTFILATVVGDHGAPGKDFFPLTVDYREKMAAGGRIPGNFFRREGRITEAEILTCRLIDRTLRPLFGAGYRSETQVQITVYAASPESDLQGLALIAASAAVHLSDLPFDGPVAGLRLVRRNGHFIALPEPKVAALADLDLVASATRDGVVMMEGEAARVTDAELLDAVEAAELAMAPILDACDRLRDAAGKPKRVMPTPDAEVLAAASTLADEVKAVAEDGLRAAFTIAEKHARYDAVQTVLAHAAATLERPAHEIGMAFSALKKQIARAVIIEGRRFDGRAHDEVRGITCEAGILATNHGSALFTRGETQTLVSTTLGGAREGQDIETLTGMTKARFLLHYNFPSFSVGEVRPNRGPGRREIGHGHLAHRALKGVMPSPSSYPYTVRVVSDVTESNGSSSMATVCGGAIAMLNAGVPLKAPVAGIAMGLIKQGDELAVLSDILGDEDHLGDMDFKVAGPSGQITAFQLDNKLGALPREVLARALTQASAGRDVILAAMQPVVEAQTDTPPEHAPRLIRIKVNPNRIGAVIGSGGRELRALQERTGAKIEVNNDGTVLIMGDNEASARAAVKAIQAISIELVKGGVYVGQVTSVKEFGAFVRISEHEGLVHVSELSEERVEAADVVKSGQKLLVRVLGADERGRLKLSAKAAKGESELTALNA